MSEYNSTAGEVASPMSLVLVRQSVRFFYFFIQPAGLNEKKNGVLGIRIMSAALFKLST